MNPMVVVLATLGFAAATPEADPQVIFDGFPLTRGLYPAGAANVAAYSNLYNPYLLNPYNALPTPLAPAVAPIAPAVAPVVRALPAPIAPVAPVVRTVAAPVTKVISAPVINSSPFRANPLTRIATPAGIHGFSRTDCVTEDGCAVLALKEVGLAPGRYRRDADADADASADPQFYYNNLGLTPNFYNGLYNNYALGFGANFYNSPLNYYNYNALPAVAPLAPAVAPVAPLVKALPAPVAPLVRALPAPVVKAVPAPLPVLRAAPVVAPVVRAPVKVVETRTKPVTYTHIGAHPVHPTTVLKTETREYLA